MRLEPNKLGDFSAANFRIETEPSRPGFPPVPAGSILLGVPRDRDERPIKLAVTGGIALQTIDMASGTARRGIYLELTRASLFALFADVAEAIDVYDREVADDPEPVAAEPFLPAPDLARIVTAVFGAEAGRELAAILAEEEAKAEEEDEGKGDDPSEAMSEEERAVLAPLRQRARRR